MHIPIYAIIATCSLSKQNTIEKRKEPQFQFNIKMLDEIATRVQAHGVTKRNEHNMIYSSGQNAHIITI
jgi:hypothetical protein